jgi:hypothetical protein
VVIRLGAINYLCLSNQVEVEARSASMPCTDGESN